MNIWKYLSLIFIGLLAVTLTSCGGDSNGGSGSTGKVSLSLTDAPNPDYEAVYVTISEIQVHRADAEEGSWQTILSPNATYNLLDLINGETAELGVATLPTGTYTQMRLILGDTPDDTENILEGSHPYANYLVTNEDEAIELKVPSGFQTGIKLVHTFDVEAGRTIGLILDFDAGRSVVKAGNSGNWLLKPTIKIIDTLNLALLTGIVTTGGIPVPGAHVSAQTYDAGTDEAAIVVSTLTSSEPGSEGAYLMYLEPGTYNIVVAADGFATACEKKTVVYDTDYTQDFALTTAVMGVVYVDLTLPESPTGPATIEFRQVWQFDPMDIEQIVVKTVNYAESSGDDPYGISLPGGISYFSIATYAGTSVTAPGSYGIGDTVTFTLP